MSIAENFYTLSLHAVRPLLPLAARGGGKLARGVRGRRGVLARMEAWAAAGREAARPLVWFHAPSVGEGLQARAVIERLRARRPDVQVVYTHFSPSAEAFARGVPADFADYLPFDLPHEVRRALALLAPAAIVFTKTEVWPNLAREAQRRGVRLALLSATLPPGSSRLASAARPLLRRAFGRLDRLAAISAADAERFGALGVPAARRTVMGDARFDQVWQRAARVSPDSELLRPLREPGRPTLVAGSTWPADEQRLLPVLAALGGRGLAPRLVLVPHEPTPAHLREAEARLEALGLSHLRLSAAGTAGFGGRDVLVVDRIGVLGELYALADVAYVGGGFGTAGLHSVLEPAAFGAPVLFGPRHHNAREAAELIAAGGGFAVADAAELQRRLERLLADAAERAAAGRAARAYVEAGRGAAERGAAVVEALLNGNHP